jgi:outer membrane immunogenic protein
LRNFLLATTALIAVASATSVFAADLIIEEPVGIIEVEAPSDWSGAYVGVHAGYGTADVEWASLPTGFFFGDFELDGALAGVQAGVNFQTDNIVYGFEADLSWSGMTGQEEDVLPAIAIRDIDWTGSLRGRLGFATETLLVYGTAGLAFADSTLDYDGFISDTVSSATHLGWTAGIGAEFMITDDISLRGEYRYSSYGDEEYEASILDIETGFDTHTITAGLNFHF